MIEFCLPTDDKLIRDIIKTSIELRLYIWADKHRIMYTGKVFDDKIVIEFPEESSYSLFILTWEDKGDKWKMPKITLNESKT